MACHREEIFAGEILVAQALHASQELHAGFQRKAAVTPALAYLSLERQYSSVTRELEINLRAFRGERLPRQAWERDQRQVQRAGETAVTGQHSAKGQLDLVDS
ncbi:hypothetical protein GCM10023088_51890 [Actinomadura verrucosospora]